MAYHDDATGEARRIELPPTVAISDSAALLPVVLGGAGIAYLPDFLARPYVSNDQLVRLWPAAEAIETVIHAIYQATAACRPRCESSSTRWLPASMDYIVRAKSKRQLQSLRLSRHSQTLLWDMLAANF